MLLKKSDLHCVEAMFNMCLVKCDLSVLNYDWHLIRRSAMSCQILKCSWFNCSCISFQVINLGRCLLFPHSQSLILLPSFLDQHPVVFWWSVWHCCQLLLWCCPEVSPLPHKPGFRSAVVLLHYWSLEKDMIKKTPNLHLLAQNVQCQD